MALGFSLAVLLLTTATVAPAQSPEFERLRLAAEQETASPEEIRDLASAYWFGRGTPKDHTKGLRWFRLAAEQGNAGAQFNLALMYHHGEGVPQDYVEGHKWLNLAASRVKGECANKVRKVRDIVAERMTSAQIAEAQRLAREWRPKTWEQLKDK